MTFYFIFATRKYVWRTLWEGTCCFACSWPPPSKTPEFVRISLPHPSSQRGVYSSHHSIMSHVFDTKNPFVWCFSPLRSNKTPHCHLGSLPLVMCARWPRASASHAVLSLIPHPRIGAACFLITCQEVSVWVCVCVSFLKPFTTRARKTLISVILSSGCLGGAKMLTGRWVQCSCSASNFASAFFVTTHPRWGCDRQPTHFWLMAALGTLKWLL